MQNFPLFLDMTFIMKWVLAALVFIILDIITGLAKALKCKEFKSSIMREGLFHKTGLILAIILFIAIDAVQAYVGIEDVIANILQVEELKFTPSVTPIMCSYIILMETGSVCENLNKLNPQLKLKKLFKFLGLGAESEKIEEMIKGGEDDVKPEN